jgi:hypothetical protein
MEMSLAAAIKMTIAVAIAGFAGSQVAETWLHGSLFAKPVKWCRDRRKEWLLLELLSCGFCLRHWTTLACLAFTMYWTGLVEASWAYVGVHLVCWFAAVRVAVLLERDLEEVVDQTGELDRWDFGRVGGPQYPQGPEGPRGSCGTHDEEY